MQSEGKVVPITGVYKKKDGRVYINLPSEITDVLDLIAEATNADRSEAMEMLVEHVIAPELERLKDAKEPTSDAAD